MSITLDQAKTLDAFAREGTLQRTGAVLRRAHSAVAYALKQLESQVGVPLFDRGGYRLALTEAGREVLGRCRALLEAEDALEAACAELRAGWEPALRIVVDAIAPLDPLLSSIRRLRSERATTRVQLEVDSLAGVEARFVREDAHLMISVMPPVREAWTCTPLPKVVARLVAHRAHPLAKARRALSVRDLEEHVLLTVRGSDPRLRLPTARLDQQATVHLPDFHAKKAAIALGVGFGWLPEWIAEKELGRGELVALRLRRGGAHTFRPYLAHRGAPGPAARRFIDWLSSRDPVGSTRRTHAE